MAYIGNDLRSNEDYKIIDDISSGFNGSATSFALQVGGATPVPFPKFEQQLLISVNGVIQEPDPTGSAGFKLSGTNIVFSSAPTNGHAFFGVIYAGADYVNAGGTFPDGSINFPSITFSADTNTGFTRTASGTVALISDGTKVAQFPTSQGSSGQALITDGGGNLSFGIPTNIVNANINANAAIAVSKLANFVTNNADDRIITGSGTTNTLNGEANLTFDGNSFITTQTTSSSDCKVIIRNSNTPASGVLRLEFHHGTGSTEGTNRFRYGFIEGYRQSGSNDGGLIFGSKPNNAGAPTERMRIDSSGRLLVGHSTGNGFPILSVSGNTGGASGAGMLFLRRGLDRATIGSNVGADLGEVDFGDLDGNIYASIQGKTDAATGSNDFPGRIILATTADGGSSPSERMRIDSSGRVGIGDTSPDAPLVVRGTASAPHTVFKVSSQSESTLFTVQTVQDSDIRIGTQTDHPLTLYTNQNERMRIDTSGRLLMGTTTQFGDGNDKLMIENSTVGGFIAFGSSATFSEPIIGSLRAYWHDNKKVAAINFFGGTDTTNKDDGSIRFNTSSANNLSERLRIESNGNVTTIGANFSSRTQAGFTARKDDSVSITRLTGSPVEVNRQNTDGNLITFYQGNSHEGDIAVSGSSVVYNGGCLSRWSQIKGLSTTDKSARPTIYQGTVMSNLDDLCSWTHPDELYEEDVLYTSSDTIPEGKEIGDVKHAKGDVLRAAYTEENQQLNMTKISDTEGDKDVAGIFWSWDDDDDEIVNDFYIAMTGDMVIRVAGSTTVARGDLLISAGDGTAKPQADDIVRSSTIAKIISTNHTATYADGSKAYPCVLMAC